VKLSGLLAGCSQPGHFVTLREELEAIDEYLDIERHPLRAAAEDREHIDPRRST
jgi:hypothetical protein